MTQPENQAAAERLLLSKVAMRTCWCGAEFEAIEGEPLRCAGGHFPVVSERSGEAEPGLLGHGEVNEAKADLARLRQELDEARDLRMQIVMALCVEDDDEERTDQQIVDRVRALRLGDEEFEQVLEKHYLAFIACDHERKMDNPQCACSLVNLGWHPTVGAAARAWVDHVLDVLRSATPDAEPAPGVPVDTEVHPIQPSTEEQRHA